MDRPLACPEKVEETSSLTAAAGGAPAWPAEAVSTGAAALALFCIVLMALLNGCNASVSSLLPNSDPALRKSAPEFAADAAKRHPYKADAPRGGEAPARASVNYASDVIQLANFADEDWRDVELWVNKTYVVRLAKLDKGADRVKTVNFWMLADAGGRPFPTNNLSTESQVYRVELLRDGTMYDVRAQPAD